MCTQVGIIIVSQKQADSKISNTKKLSQIHASDGRKNCKLT